MAKSNFFEQYKDPRWQEKRLKILQRDDFSCVSCDNHTSTLHVHHKVSYRKNTKPWEYENDELITLCENCHKQITAVTNNCKTLIMSICHSVDVANQIEKIIEELDGLTPPELMMTHKSLKNLRKTGEFKIIEDE